MPKHQKICTAVHQNGTPYFIIPIIVVSKPAQAGLYASDGNGHFGIGFPDLIAVYDGSPIRSLARFASRRIGVVAAWPLACSIMANHGVYVTGRYQKAQPRPAESLKVRSGMPIRLCDDGYFIAVAFQYAADDGSAKAGMIYIGIARHQAKIRPIPAAFFHFRPCQG